MHTYECKIEMPGGEWITVQVQATNYDMAKTVAKAQYGGHVVTCSVLF